MIENVTDAAGFRHIVLERARDDDLSRRCASCAEVRQWGGAGALEGIHAGQRGSMSATSWLRVPLAQKPWSRRKISPLRYAFLHKRLMKGTMSVLTSFVLSSLTSAAESALNDLRLAEVAPETLAQLRSVRSSSTVTLAGAEPAACGGAAPAPGVGAGGGAGAGGGCGAAAGIQA